MNPIIGVNLPSNSGVVDPEAARRTMTAFRENGFDALEISLDTFPLIIDRKICEPWLERLQRLLVDFPFKYSGHIGRGLDLRDLERKEEHQSVLRASIDICSRLGFSPLVLHYELRSRNRETEKYFLEAHRRAADYAGERGVLIVVENIEVEVVEPVVELVASVDSKALRMAFDTGHAFLASRYFDFDFMNAFKSSLPYIAHLHLSDNTGTFEELRITDRPTYDSLPMGYRFEYGRGDIHVPPYFGRIPFDDLFALLGDYCGTYLCEYYSERFLPLNGDVQRHVREQVVKSFARRGVA